MASVTEGKVSTTAPGPYSNGDSQPVSLDVNGGVRMAMSQQLDKTNDAVAIGFRSRVLLTLTVTPFTSVNSETLISSFSKNLGGVVSTGLGSYTITSGKTLHITHIVMTTRSTSATAAQQTIFSLRNNTAGATTNASGLVTAFELSGSPVASAVDGQADHLAVALGDYGLMFTGDGTNSIGVSTLSSSTAGKDSITLIGYEDTTP